MTLKTASPRCHLEAHEDTPLHQVWLQTAEWLRWHHPKNWINRQVILT